MSVSNMSRNVFLEQWGKDLLYFSRVLFLILRARCLYIFFVCCEDGSSSYTPGTRVGCIIYIPKCCVYTPRSV